MNYRQILILTFFCACAAYADNNADNHMTVIDYPSASGTTPWGMNSRGDIAGNYTGADNINHGFLLNGGHFTAIDYPGAAVTLIHGVGPRGEVLGEFGATATSPHRGYLLGTDGVYTAFDFPGAATTALFGINARGEIAGFYTLADGSRHTFLSSGGRLTKIDYPGATATGAFGITPEGEVYGVYVLNGVGHGYVYSTGTGFTTIDYPGSTFTYVTGRNASGDIAGHWVDPAGVSHGYILSNGQFTSIDYPGASFTALSAIDAAGNILGRTTINGVNRGFLLATTRPPLRYTVRDLGAVGALPGQPETITNNSLTAGAVMTESGLLHAVVWSPNGAMNDLGSEGLNSFGYGINDSGLTVGQAEIAFTDPSGEDFCGTQALGLAGTSATCAAFAAQNGVMRTLRTLGGANGFARAVNGLGQIAGTAENTTLDPACPSPQKYQFKPVLWEGEDVVELPTVGGDPNGIANSVNDNGEIVGASGNCVAYNTRSLSSLQPVHALLWETGRVTDLGNLGGKVGHSARTINNAGEVVGTSDIADDKAGHAFRWTRNTGIQDLGTLPGDRGSAGLAINDQGVITGVSVTPDFSPRAFVWSGGVMTDLNQLIPAKSALYLLTACSINARGEIIGFAMDANGNTHAYLAAPVAPDVADFEMGVSPSTAARGLMRRIGLEMASENLRR